jgi:hypothetical protein
MVYILKSILFPSYFFIGSDIEIARREKNDRFYKKFKKHKYDKFVKTLYLMRLFHKEKYVPDLIEYNTSNLEIISSDCGNLLTIETLPVNWEYQLMTIKKECIKQNILLRDWGLWEVNPFLINNITIKNETLYFIDLGDAEYGDRETIEKYFQKKITSINLIVKYSYLYLLFHYPRRVFIMILRKLQRPYNLVMLFLVYHYLK